MPIRQLQRLTYGATAPIYDRIMRGVSAPWRARSLAALAARPGERVLIVGAGTGLDFPHLPHGPDYLALDLTHAMLRQARLRVQAAPAIRLIQGDGQRLPLPDASLDHAVAHLILAVVPDGGALLAELARCLRPGGQVLVLDKFLRPGQRAPLRRALNPLIAPLATRLDVVLEDLLAQRPEFVLEHDAPLALGGWFRQVRLKRAETVPVHA